MHLYPHEGKFSHAAAFDRWCPGGAAGRRLRSARHGDRGQLAPRRARPPVAAAPRGGGDALPRVRPRPAQTPHPRRAGPLLRRQHRVGLRRGARQIMEHWAWHAGGAASVRPPPPDRGPASRPTSSSDSWPAATSTSRSRLLRQSTSARWTWRFTGRRTGRHRGHRPRGVRGLGLPVPRGHVLSVPFGHLLTATTPGTTATSGPGLRRRHVQPLRGGRRHHPGGGADYRREILEPNGTRDPLDMLRAFLDASRRPPTFLRLLGIDTEPG